MCFFFPAALQKQLSQKDLQQHEANQGSAGLNCAMLIGILVMAHKGRLNNKGHLICICSATLQPTFNNAILPVKPCGPKPASSACLVCAFILKFPEKYRGRRERRARTKINKLIMRLDTPCVCLSLIPIIKRSRDRGQPSIRQRIHYHFLRNVSPGYKTPHTASR